MENYKTHMYPKTHWDCIQVYAQFEMRQIQTYVFLDLLDIKLLPIILFANYNVLIG